MTQPYCSSLTRKIDGELVKGNNVILCNNRFIIGPDRLMFVLTVISTIIPVALTLGLPLSYLTTHHPPAGWTLLSLETALFLLTLAFMFATSFSDPGIMPRNSELPAGLEEARKQSEKLGGAAAHAGPVRQMYYHGRPVRVSFCETCLIWRPPHSTHCSQCNNCVEKFDHHCPFLANCVGKRNHRSFYYFNLAGFLLSLNTLVTCITYLTLRAHDVRAEQHLHSGADGLKHALQMPSPVVVLLLAIYSTLPLAFTSALLGLHTYLLCSGKSTREVWSRTTYNRSLIELQNRGLRNFVRTLCRRVPRSRLRAFHSGDDEFNEDDLEEYGLDSVDGELYFDALSYWGTSPPSSRSSPLWQSLKRLRWTV